MGLGELVGSIINSGEVGSAVPCSVVMIEVTVGEILVVSLPSVGEGSSCRLEELHAADKISRMDREIKIPRNFLFMSINPCPFVIRNHR